MNADGRFAPSPTGPLHLGGLRTALVAWLFARSQGGRYLIRIEDLDPGRSRPEHERQQLTDLQALGLTSDGRPVRQSERRELYERALEELGRRAELYPCFCTRAEIREAASAPHGDRPEGAYPGTCRRLSLRQRSQLLRSSRPAALRLDAGAVRVEFTDRLLGRQSTLLDDFVVRRADGIPAYQLAVVVDDAAQGIDEVVRGADLAGSTARQIELQKLLGLPTPRYAHVALVLGPDGSRLAKRHGGATLADRSEPAALTLAFLAHTLGLAADRRRLTHPGELLDEFDPSRLPRQPIRISGP